MKTGKKVLCSLLLVGLALIILPCPSCTTVVKQLSNEFVQMKLSLFTAYGDEEMMQEGKEYWNQTAQEIASSASKLERNSSERQKQDSNQLRSLVGVQLASVNDMMTVEKQASLHDVTEGFQQHSNNTEGTLDKQTQIILEKTMKISPTQIQTPILNTLQNSDNIKVKKLSSLQSEMKSLLPQETGKKNNFENLNLSASEGLMNNRSAQAEAPVEYTLQKLLTDMTKEKALTLQEMKKNFQQRNADVSGRPEDPTQIQSLILEGFKKPPSSSPATPVPSRNEHPRITPVSPGNTVKIVAVGDICMARDIETEIQKRNNDYTLPFQKIKSFLEGFDIKIANLESAITNRTAIKKPFRICPHEGMKCCGTRCHFKTSPDVLKGIVDYAGFNVLTIENNHIEDFWSGRKDTMDTLNAYNVSWMDQHHSIHVKEFKECNFTFLGYDITYKTHEALKHIKENMISAVKKIDDASFVLIFIHGGIEYSSKSISIQHDFAKTAVDYGADMVIYSHAHVPQEFVQYKGKHIFYGLGNFIFDQKERDDPEREHVRDILIVAFDLENCHDVTKVDVWNARINDDFQPVLTTLNATILSEVSHMAPRKRKRQSSSLMSESI